MNDSEITFRLAQMSDLKEMQALFVETISAICKDDYEPAQIRVWTSSIENIERWTDKLENQYFLIAQCDNKIIGYVSLENDDFIDFIYVHKDFQKQGIAGRLYDKIEKEAIKRGATTLKSDVSITARPFFEKRGFKVLSKHNVRIRDIEIANYKMAKELTTYK
jgi:putative acetyltransferase